MKWDHIFSLECHDIFGVEIFWKVCSICIFLWKSETIFAYVCENWNSSVTVASESPAYWNHLLPGFNWRARNVERTCWLQKPGTVVDRACFEALKLQGKRRSDLTTDDGELFISNNIINILWHFRICWVWSDLMHLCVWRYMCVPIECVYMHMYVHRNILKVCTMRSWVTSNLYKHGSNLEKYS